MAKDDLSETIALNAQFSQSNLDTAIRYIDEVDALCKELEGEVAKGDHEKDQTTPTKANVKKVYADNKEKIEKAKQKLQFSQNIFEQFAALIGDENNFRNFLKNQSKIGLRLRALNHFMDVNGFVNKNKEDCRKIIENCSEKMKKSYEFLDKMKDGSWLKKIFNENKTAFIGLGLAAGGGLAIALYRKFKRNAEAKKEREQRSSQIISGMNNRAAIAGMPKAVQANFSLPYVAAQAVVGER